jgi:hypothetical protein
MPAAAARYIFLYPTIEKRVHVMTARSVRASVSGIQRALPLRRKERLRV